VFFFVVTSDVQRVLFTREQGDSYSIQCSYLNGSVASGCVYILVSGIEGVVNITGSMNRNDSSGVLLLIPNIGCYSEVVVFTINVTDALPIRESINATDMECSTLTGELS
jgi:hypothetical protein